MDKIISVPVMNGIALTDPESQLIADYLGGSFCVDALEEAIHRYGKPEIFNTDQGSQYTGDAFTQVPKKNEIRISMDGKGAWRDNVFVERLWRNA